MKILLSSVLIAMLFTSCISKKLSIGDGGSDKDTDAITNAIDSTETGTKIEGDTLIFESNNETETLNKSEEISYSEDKSKTSKTTIKTNSNQELITTIDKSQQMGLIAYSVPKEMQVGIKYNIKIRITRDNNETDLIIGNRRIAIGDSNISSISVESIRVENTMSADIISENGTFQIDTLSTSLQDIDKTGYTEWEWEITPLKAGNDLLKLIVRVRVKTDDGLTYKDIIVYDKTVMVKSNTKFVITRFISNYWQWLITTIIIPIIVWLFKRRKDKE